jgi:peptidoglycan/LPS O-acetylase OafA/YrhL
MQSTAPRGRLQGRIPALDGLRGVAVLLVLLYHAGVAGFPGGFLGVSIFFTLSGYLITSLLLDEAGSTGSIDLRRFWAARARRLVPALLVGVALAVAYTATVGAAEQQVRLRGDVLASLGAVANWRFVLDGHAYTDWFVERSPLLHLWSLGVELQFYLLFPPLLLAALRRWSTRRVTWLVGLVTIASTLLAWSMSAAGTASTRAYFGTDTRAAELLVGALLAMLGTGAARAIGVTERRLIGAAGLVGGGALLWFAATARTSTPWLYMGGLLVHALCAALVILAVLHDAGLVPRVLRCRPLQWVGVVSYGAYVYHWPVFLWLDEARSGLSGPGLLAARFAVTLSLATLSYLLLEKPIRMAARRSTRHAAVALAAAALLVIAGVGAGAGARPSLLVQAAAGEQGPPPVVSSTGPLPADDSPSTRPHASVAPPAPHRTPPPRSAQAVGDEVAAPSAQALPTRAVPFPRPRHDPPRIMVVGDSVASTLGKGLEAWSQAHGGAVIWATWRYGCGIPRGGEVRFTDGFADLDPACDDWPRVWTEHLERFDPDVVVVLSGVWDLTDRRHERWDGVSHIGRRPYDTYLLAEYEAAADVLGARGAGVVWLTMPCVSDHTPPGPLSGTDAFELDRVVDLNTRIIPELLARRSGSVRSIDLFAAMCPDGEFQRSFGDAPDARPDGLHFDHEGAWAVAGWLLPQLLGAPDPAFEVQPAAVARVHDG